MTVEEQEILKLRKELAEQKAKYQSLANSFYLSVTTNRTPERMMDIIYETKAQQEFNTSFDNLSAGDKMRIVEIIEK